MKAVLVFVLLLLPLRVGAGVYKWVDEKGTIHYSNAGMHAPAGAQRSAEEPEDEPPGGRRAAPANDRSGAAAPTAPYVLEGIIIDPHRRLLQGMMQEGARWNGKLDAIGRQTVSIKAYHDAIVLQTVHPNEDAGFRLSLSRPATHITLENGGGGLYLRKDGPWSQDGRVELSLDSNTFSVNGHVRTTTDEAVSGTMVSAFDESGKQISFCYTNSKGYFEFTTNYPISVLKARADGLELAKRGDWHASGSVVLAPEKEKLITISGVVRDKDGRPVNGARVDAAVTGGMGKSTMTGDDGHYEIEVDRSVSSVHAYSTLTRDQTEQKGPFDQDSRVDLVFSKGKAFTISGRVTDPHGNAAHGVFVFATDDKSHRIATTRADRRGYYTLELGREARVMHARYVAQSETRVGGPWSEDATVDIQLEQ